MTHGCFDKFVGVSSGTDDGDAARGGLAGRSSPLIEGVVADPQ